MGIGRRTTPVAALGLVIILTSSCQQAAPASTTPTPAGSPSPAVASPSATPAPSAVPPSPTATPAGFVTPFQDSDLACTIGHVEAAETNVATLTPVTDCAAQPNFTRRVLAGGLVTTDPCGQAVLNSKCGTVYVFQDSTMRFSACDQQTTTSGTGCVADGTIAWNNTCPNGVAAVLTPAARLELDGTWISATYLPDRQIALFTVLAGSARATPLDASGAPIGDGVEVQRESFWFSGTNGEAAIVGGFDGQRAYPIEQMPQVIEELQLASTVAAIGAQAATDGIRTELPAPRVINVRGRGGPLDATAVQQAVLLAMDWPSRISQLFPDGDGKIFALIGEAAPRDLAFSSQDFASAAKTIEDLKLTGSRISVIADRDDRVLRLAEVYLPMLKELRLVPELTILGPDDALALYEKSGSAGEPTIWLSTR
jgi:hypothetical protein